MAVVLVAARRGMSYGRVISALELTLIEHRVQRAHRVVHIGGLPPSKPPHSAFVPASSTRTIGLQVVSCIN